MLFSDMKQLTIKAEDGLLLSATLFETEAPKALVQIIHGSVEHKERYYEFAQYLCDHNYAVIISDNRGHGASVNTQYPLGFMDGVDQIIADQYVISKYICLLYPEIKLYLFGHSLGSVFARCYLRKHDDQIAKLVLSGTVHYNPFTPLGIMLTKAAIAISGKHAYNKLLRDAVMNNDDLSWLSENKENIEAYKADPLCGFAYPNSSVLTVMQGVQQLKESKHYQFKNNNLHILSISGKGDPVTGGTAGLRKSFRLLQRIGYHNFEQIVFPGMKHEVLNETNRLEVFNSVLYFFEQD
ncbi:MAG TPA: alpha/beta hydrolase [Porphyromonadaceae bacterium]|nr:alpha/beta hydrolase [Porphyromonadaceae bacterium]